MMQSFWIEGTLPGVNDYTGKKSRWEYGRLKKQAETRICHAILAAKLTPMPRAHLTYHWHEPIRRGKQQRDPDNCMGGTKFINDALVTMKILPDDSLMFILGLTHHFLVNQQKPGVRVVLDDQHDPE